jgi:hypothetical protein
MGKPWSERQEKMAHFLHAGASVIEAFEWAGYPPNLANADKAAKALSMQKRLAELRGLPTAGPIAKTRVGATRLNLETAEIVGKRGVSKEALIGFQLQILEASIASGAVAAATAGVKQLAQLQGLWVERSEAKQIIEKAEDDPKRIARAILDVIDRQMIDVTPLPGPETTS